MIPVLDSNKIELIATEAAKHAAIGTPWGIYFQDILGPTGLVRRTFQGVELDAYMVSEAYASLIEAMVYMRSEESGEDNKVITVRLPASVHAALRVEAYEQRTSMNQLCVSKLLMPISARFVPKDC